MDHQLTDIREGMDVYDMGGDKIGTVEYVQFGDEDPTKPGAETQTGTSYEARGDTFVDDIAEALAPSDRLPETIRARMRRHGFVRIDTGLLSKDRIFMLDQVASINDDGVRLRVSRDELVEA